MCDNLLARQGFHATGSTVPFNGANLYGQCLSADGHTDSLTSTDSEGWYIVYRPYNG